MQRWVPGLRSNRTSGSLTVNDTCFIQVGVDLLKTVAADKATSTATAASPAIQAFTGPDAKALIATATALTLAAAAGATVYLYKQGRLNGDALEAYRETLEGYSRQLADTLVTYKSSLGTTLEGYKTGLESTLGRTKERVTAYISSLRNVAPESDSGVSMPEMVQVPPSEQSASSPSHASDAGGEFDDYSAGASSVVSLPSSETPLDEPEREELGLKKLMIRDGDDLSAGCLTPGGQLSPALPPSEHGEGDVPAAMGMSAISTSSSEGRSVEDWIIVKEQGKHEEQVQESENVPSEAELAKVDQ